MISKSVLALTGLLALLWAGTAAAQTTNCPTNLTCAFNSAETRALSTTAQPPNQAGAPDVYIGYLVFGSGSPVPVTMTSVAMLNGTFSNSSFPGTCTPGQNGNAATIDFNSGPQWMFVTVNSGGSNEELDFIQTRDVDTNAKSTTNSVRVGVCRSPAP